MSQDCELTLTSTIGSARKDFTSIPSLISKQRRRLSALQFIVQLRHCVERSTDSGLRASRSREINLKATNELFESEHRF